MIFKLIGSLYQYYYTKMQIQDIQLITVCVIGFTMCITVFSNLILSTYRNNKDVERIRELEEENHELKVKLAKIKRPLTELQEQIQKFNQTVESIENDEYECDCDCECDDDVSEESDEDFEEDTESSDSDDGDDEVTDDNEKKESSDEETNKAKENMVTYRYKLRSVLRPVFVE